MNYHQKQCKVTNIFLCRCLTLLLLTLVLMVPAWGQTGAFASENVSGSTGLLPPTPEEQAWMNENMIRVERVFPNRLAHDRVAAEHEKHGKGLSKTDLLFIPVAEHGAEFHGS